MQRKKLFLIGMALSLAGCINAAPKEVTTDPDGPSTGAILGEEIKTAGFGLESQVKEYDVKITGEVQTEEAKPLEIAFELSGTVDNNEDEFELDGELEIVNQTKENQTLMLFEPHLNETEDKHQITVAPAESYHADLEVLSEGMDGATYVYHTEGNEISAYNQRHFSKRITNAFQALGDYAAVLDKTAHESTIHYTGEVYEQLDDVLSLFWYDPYRVLGKEADESGPMTFELVVDAETKLAESLTVTDTQASFLIEFSSMEEGVPE